MSEELKFKIMECIGLAYTAEENENKRVDTTLANAIRDSIVHLVQKEAQAIIQRKDAEIERLKK